MRTKIAFLAPVVALAAATLASAQSPDILYYKFVTGSGTNVINFAPGGPANGTITGTVASPWTTGVADNALRGGTNVAPTTNNAVDSGWKPVLTDDFTFAFFMKQENSPATTLSYVFSGVGSFRTFTNGVAGKGLWCRAWGGAPADLKLTTDIQAAAASTWVHVALVVDWTASKTAVWYVDGKPTDVIPLTAGAKLTGTTNFFLGQHGTSGNWTYNTDEFRFSTRAASPGEVAAWAAMKPAGDNTYNAANCGATLGSKNGPPSLGTPGYQLALNGSATSPFALSIGFKRGAILFDLGLLFPVLKGCVWDSSLDLVFGGATDSNGDAVMPLPIPNDKGLAGANLWSQALILVNTQGSNGFNTFIN